MPMNHAGRPSSCHYLLSQTLPFSFFNLQRQKEKKTRTRTPTGETTKKNNSRFGRRNTLCRKIVGHQIIIGLPNCIGQFPICYACHSTQFMTVYTYQQYLCGPLKTQYNSHRNCVNSLNFRPRAEFPVAIR